MEWLDSIPITDEEADASTKSKHRRPMDDLPNIQYDVRCFSESTCKVSEGEEMTRQKNNCDYLYFLQDVRIQGEKLESETLLSFVFISLFFRYLFSAVRSFLAGRLYLHFVAGFL